MRLQNPVKNSCRNVHLSHNEGLLRVELIYALYDMIGKGETGLYTELNRNWTKIEETICMYIDYLKLE